MLIAKEYLGKGWAFPPRFIKEKAESRVGMAVAQEDIEQSLQILLSTSLGERIMQPSYGCNLGDYQFESMSSTLLGFIRDTVERAILYHEARISVENIEVTEAGSQDLLDGYLRILIEYQVRATNSRYNYVYRFYLNEGSAEELYQTGK